MRVGLGWLGLSARDFWALTPKEFAACVEGWAELRGLTAAPGLGREEARELRAFLAERGDEPA